ncbi:ABC transporter ATP-binding protein [Streptococcus mutans]|jgi:putative ABC transporter, ATP-binding protein|uniref:ABC transporter ATP-binding protein n=1 Tax=Streptococcus mutans TaxID=1309 RepID=UPI0002B532BF|nr:ABC transporter ATP-binding protein [Streptococcus mutans]EMC43414.1 putative ABC transporter, ATP-binding protein [Streptococcus mutans 24]EMP57587.1 ABC transporter ATP-binding protein [Streptococcus mutans KK23]NLQ41904.1 ABC transporter ATP-binding protein [Streptococcus mutans]NLQ84456.1 ABC transporter ATP-binding protein [Streptococcus mutans]QNT16523.1 ABC transporter ATP-binding protein [Streptococcus mutans B04Sm5]
MLIKAIMCYRRHAVTAIVMIAIVVSGSLLQPRYLNTVLGAVLEDKQDKVYSTGLLLLMIASAGLIAGIINIALASKISQEVSADIRERVFRTIQKFSYADVEELGAGNLVVRVTNDVSQIQHLVMAIFQVILRVPILLLGSFILAIVTIPQLWWLVLGMVPLIIAVVVMIITMVSPQFNRFQTLIDKMNTIVKEQLYGILVVKSFVQEKNQNKKFEKISDELVKINIFVGNWFAFMEPAMTLIVFFAMYIAIYVVSDLAKTDPIVVGKIAVFLAYAMQMMFSIIMLGSMGMQISRSVVSIGRIQELLNRGEPKITFGNESAACLEGRIDFEHVSFTYPQDDKETLSDVSFLVDAGQVVGIVGTTGSGKSTLAQLLPRLFDPDSGQIKIGGRDIKDFNQETLRQLVSIVLQQVILFSGTIADNLRQGFSAADQRMMEYAAGIAQANEFINQLSDNYESLVEERGSNFSGGQKQRLSLARGIIGQSKILILDDSTSALDAKSERLVQEALEHKLKGTTIIIAQKISSVVHADKILVLDRGRLVGQGTHGELMESNAVYGKIYASQKGKEE